MADSFTQSQTQWLIRKAPACLTENGHTVNSVLGPYLTSQVRSMVEQGMLDVDDEICPENGYWFLLSDAAEVRKQLGVDPPAFRAGSEEVTQPDMPNAEEPTIPELILEGIPPSDPESTGMIKVSRPAAKSNPKKQEPAAAPAPQAKPTAPPPGVSAAASIGMQYPRVRLSSAYGFRPDESQPRAIRVEKGRFWAILLAIGVGFAVIGILWAIRMLHRAV